MAVVLSKNLQVFESEIHPGEGDDIHDPELPLNLSDAAKCLKNWWTAIGDLRFECYAMFDSKFLKVVTVFGDQIMGYGFAGLYYKLLVEPPQMWWPHTLIQVSLFR